MKKNRVTLVSLLTPVGEGGISVIKLCGPRARKMILAAFHPKNERLFRKSPPGKLFYGLVKDGDAIVDEVILECEDEDGSEYSVNCHGGVAAAEAVIRRFEALGARRVSGRDFAAMKEGELYAEIFDGLTGAVTEKSAIAFACLAGGILKGEILRIRELARGAESSEKKKGECLGSIKELLSTYEGGRNLLAGKRIVIAGLPNVGKSSIANALVGTERSIVDETPGTTRDLVISRLAIRGMPFEVIDTAGLKAGTGGVEARGIQRAAEEMENADGVIYVVDATRGLTGEEKAALYGFDTRKTICAINKIDLPRKISIEDVSPIFSGRIIETSAKEKTNIKELSQVIYKRFSIVDEKVIGKAFIFTERQRKILEDILNRVNSTDSQAPVDYIDGKIDEFIFGAQPPV